MNTQKKKQQNIIFILSDTLSANHMSLYGYHRKTTPFLEDFFGTQGIIFTNVRSNSSWTLPSVASFMRSKLPSRIRVGDLMRKENTLPEILRQNDFEVVAFLKNFDKPIVTLKSVGALFHPEEYRTFNYHDHETGFIEAGEWLCNRFDKKDTEQKPFFLFIHDTTAHNPYEETPAVYKEFFGPLQPGHATDRDYLIKMTYATENLEQEKERITLLYDQGVRYLDDLLRKFIENIPKEILKSSILVFMSDHGDEFGNHHRNFSHGYSMHEDIIRVPLVMRIPGMHPKRISQAVSLLDISPTILSLVSIRAPKDFEGSSVLQKRKKRFFGKVHVCQGNFPFFPRGTDLYAIKKESLNLPIIDQTHKTYIIGKWKFMKCGDKREVYDLKRDSREKNNLCNAASTSVLKGGIREFLMRKIAFFVMLFW